MRKPNYTELVREESSLFSSTFKCIIVEAANRDDMTPEEVRQLIAVVQEKINNHYDPLIAKATNQEVKTQLEHRKEYHEINFVGLLGLVLIQNEEDYKRDAKHQELTLARLATTIFAFDKKYVHQYGEEAIKTRVQGISDYVEETELFSEVRPMTKKYLEIFKKALPVNEEQKGVGNTNNLDSPRGRTITAALFDYCNGIYFDNMNYSDFEKMIGSGVIDKLIGRNKGKVAFILNSIRCEFNMDNEWVKRVEESVQINGLNKNTRAKLENNKNEVFLNEIENIFG